MELLDGEIQCHYLGSWKNGNMEGLGGMKFTDGTSFVGNWLNNSMHGYGVCHLPTDVHYEGCWERGMPQGLFKITFGNNFWIEMYF